MCMKNEELLICFYVTIFWRDNVGISTYLERSNGKKCDN